jgi:tRNA-splicing ligase RtcB
MAREMSVCIGLDSFRGAARHAPEYLVGADIQRGAGPARATTAGGRRIRRRRDVVRDPGLGTVGSGNHFVEFATVAGLLDRRCAWEHDLRSDEVVFMIHSGSRVVGKHVGLSWMDRARADWPQGLPHPAHGLYGLQGPAAHEYLGAMGTASLYAWLNRAVLTEMVRIELAAVFSSDATALVVDVPHNVVLQERQEGGVAGSAQHSRDAPILNVHRKGSTPAHAGQLALIPGSMGTASYLVQGLGNPDWLSSCSHGAGRSVRRQVMRREVKAQLRSTTHEPCAWQCVTLREERRIEEAPEAYKPIGRVIEAQEQAGLLWPVAELRPVLTFKA